MSRTYILVAVAALLFLIAVVVALYQLGDAGSQEVVNRYRGSQFSFTYPLGLDIEEYPNGSLAIGSTTPTGFASAVDLALLTPASADPDDEITASFDEQIMALCAETTPSGRVFCDTVVSADTVKLKEGEAQAYYLSLTRERAGMQPETTTIGPLYAFVLPAPEGNPADSYRLLVVHTPPAGVPDAALLTRIADSITTGPPKGR